MNPANNYNYFLLSSSTWTDAESEAVALGGHLATVNNLTENNWISTLWGTNRDLWIGLNDPTTGDGGGAQHAADFVWSSGSTSTYRNWRAGEPNNANTGEYWAYILANGLAGGGQWNDGANSATTLGQPNSYGVVEVVPEPSPATLFLFGLFAVLGVKRVTGQRKLNCVTVRQP